MTADRSNIYIDKDVRTIIDEVKPKSISGYFNESVRERHMLQEQLNKLCADVAEIKAILKSLSPNHEADQAR